MGGCTKVAMVWHAPGGGSEDLRGINSSTSAGSIITALYMFRSGCGSIIMSRLQGAIGKSLLGFPSMIYVSKPSARLRH
jgi:hypothetical protein